MLSTSASRGGSKDNGWGVGTDTGLGVGSGRGGVNLENTYIYYEMWRRDLQTREKGQQERRSNCSL